jgi:hypothetical protein
MHAPSLFGSAFWYDAGDGEELGRNRKIQKIVRACGRGRLRSHIVQHGFVACSLAQLVRYAKLMQRKLGIVWFGLGLVPPHAKLILL